MTRKMLAVLCAVAVLSLCGCGGKEPPAEETPSAAAGESITVTFMNDVEEADVWILPQTEKILKTTLWGKAGIEASEPGTQQELVLEGTDGSGTYIIRVIDERGGYYAANDVHLEQEYSVHFYDNGSFAEAVFEIRDEKGAVTDSFPAFEGMLGAK